MNDTIFLTHTPFDRRHTRELVSDMTFLTNHTAAAELGLTWAKSDTLGVCSFLTTEARIERLNSKTVVGFENYARFVDEQT